MAEDQIAGKSAARKKTALLGLATETKAGAGECLNPEAMTAFVSGHCTAEEKQEGLRHISLCRRCYGEWLVLMELQLENGRRQRRAEKVPFYLKPANLAALVSAMAAVICVGLFLDINPFGYRIDGEPAPPVATMRQKSAPIPAAGDQEEDTSGPPDRPRPTDKATRLQQIPSGRDRKSTAETMDQDAAEPSSSEKKRAVPPRALPQAAPPPPLPAEGERRAEAAAPAPGEEPAAGQGPTPALSLRQWHQELTAICRGREDQQAGRLRLDAHFRQGKRALPAWRQQSPSSPADRALQRRLLPLLDQARDMDMLLARCPEILAAGNAPTE